MKYSLAIALLIGATSSVLIARGDTPWIKESLPECPKDKKRTKMDDQKTHVVKYPYVGASCKLYIPEQDISLVMSLPDELQGGPPPPPAAPATEAAAAPAEVAAPAETTEKKAEEPAAAEPKAVAAPVVAEPQPAKPDTESKKVKLLKEAAADSEK